ncbi:hypothetical protein VTI74DRAFT_717 [Chaetomium olivicolor]
MLEVCLNQRTGSLIARGNLIYSLPSLCSLAHLPPGSFWLLNADWVLQCVIIPLRMRTSSSHGQRRNEAGKESQSVVGEVCGSLVGFPNAGISAEFLPRSERLPALGPCRGSTAIRPVTGWNRPCD